jgi:dienelactone hydrolase
MFKHLAGAALAATLLASPLSAAVVTKTVEYKVGDTNLKGFLAWDDAHHGKRPAVIVVHEWWGLNDYAKERAKQLAALGYVAFAADMYGDGKTTEHPEDAGKWATAISQNLPEGLARAKAAIEIVKADPHTDGAKVAAIGYCFGGAVVMHMAYAGLDVKGVASFHGSLPTAPETTTAIAAKIAVYHGAADAFVPATQIQNFTAALDKLKADWSMTSYGGAVHSFTVAGSENRKIPGIAHDANADRRSWASLQSFLGELFGR